MSRSLLIVTGSLTAFATAAIICGTIIQTHDTPEPVTTTVTHTVTVTPEPAPTVTVTSTPTPDPVSPTLLERCSTDDWYMDPVCVEAAS